MTTLPVHRRHRALFPEIADLLGGFPSFTGLRSFDGNVIRLEDEVKDGSYEVRAELPGVDPVNDVDVTIRDGYFFIMRRPPRRRNRTADPSSPTARSCDR